MSALLETFRARCQATARDYAIGKVDLIMAVDQLHDFAFTRGVVDELGQDVVQTIMAEAFAPVREGVTNIHTLGDDYDGLSATFARACQLADAEYARLGIRPSRTDSHLPDSTIAAAEYLVRLNDRDRLRAWLIEHTPVERGLILQHFENKKGRRAA
jgi:hypothetical protein